MRNAISKGKIKKCKKKNMFITTVIMLFISFSLLNIVLILNFVNILNNMTIGIM